MSEPVIIQKQPGVARDYEFTWDDAASDPITASAWTTATGITIDANSFTNTTTIIRFSSGTDGQNYRVKNTVTFTSGQTDYRWVTVEVRERVSTLPLLDATVGGASANSYETLVEANTYFALRLYSSAWASATVADKERALSMACRRIEQESFIGYRATTTQALKWPRSGAPIPDSFGYYEPTEIPQLVKDAQCEYALEFIGADVGAQSDLSNFKRVKVGPIELEINQPVQSGIFPAEVSRLLRDLRTSGSGAQIVRA